ncbi:MAG TPA: hypothetical protein VM164_04835 [Burkholderiales bacterium]|nr:hypothetical protein [Burkholderiales bacterium]
MFTFLTVAGVIALLAGFFIIARTHRMPGAEKIADEDGAAAATSLAVETLDDRRVATRLGLSLNALGAILILLDLADVTVSPATATIAGFVVFIFLVAHQRYASHMRAAQRNA